MKLASLFVFISFFVVSPANAAPKPKQLPKLLVWIVIDQMRADELLRYKDRFTAGGFKRLMDKGAYFSHAQYDTLQSMTCVGHAVMVTGANPYRNGISSNRWFDRATKKAHYCIEDSSQSTVGLGEKNADFKKELGRSPTNLVASTITDEIKSAYPKSRVIALSLKDRGAVTLAGHRGDLALWQDWKTSKWVTSSYYAKTGKLPDWLEKFNLENTKSPKPNQTWNASPDSAINNLPPSTIVHESFQGQKKGFPYEMKPGDRNFALGPWTVQELFKTAKRSFDELNLGQTEQGIDVLAISVSTHDYVGHNFGPNSREIEEISRAEDQEIASLLNHIDRKVGLKETIIVLTADHGAPPNPDELKALGLAAGRIDEKQWLDEMNQKLSAKWGTPGQGNYLLASEELNFYFDDQALQSKKISKSQADETLKGLLMEKPEVAHVFTQSEFKDGKRPPELLGKQLAASFVQGRSGDVIVNPKPNFMLDGDAVSHHTGYSYDRYVPMIIMGQSVKPGRYPGGNIIDLAPTLSFILGVIPPNSSEGTVLSEILTLRN